jgi:hypothetical protein
MLQRCEYPGHNRFAQYGGRGIRVCERWHRFEAFAADMGPIPPGMTLERLNPNGDYEPGNCVWASRAVQAASRRPVTTRLNGQPLSVFARAHGFDRENFARRLRRSGLAGHDWDVSGSGPGEVLDISGQQLHFMAVGSQSRVDAPA